VTTLSLPRRHLVDAVAQAAHGDYIRLSVEDAVSLTVTGADMYTMTSTSLWAKLPLDVVASVTLPTKLLTATAKALPGDDVALTITTSRLQLRSGSYRGEIAGQGRVGAVYQISDDAWRDLSVDTATELCQALSCASAAMLSDPARPAPSGVRVDPDGSVVGTDGNRMHWVTTSWRGGAFTLPPSCVGAVVDILGAVAVKPTKSKKKGAAQGGDDIGTLCLSCVVGVNNVAFRLTTPIGTRTLFCRRAPEPFPEWRRIARDGGAVAATLTLDHDVLMATLKSCPAEAISLCPTPLRLLLDYVVYDDTSTRRLGEGGVEVAAKSSSIVASSPLGFAVKVSTVFLRDAVACCGPDVVLEMSPSQPVRVRSGSFVGVVMFQR
jgi:hypothetical protein